MASTTLKPCWKNPEKHSVGRFDPTDPNVASGMVGAPSCGDVMKLDIKLDGDTIEDVKFKTYGCGSAIASSTLFVDMLKGRTIKDAKKIKDKDIAKQLGIDYWTTIVIYKNNKEVYRSIGQTDKAKIYQVIKSL